MSRVAPAPGRSALVLVAALLAVLAAVGSAGAAGPGAPVGKRYVALGDSYSSGPGLAPSREPGCGRSAVNYASRLAAALGLGPERRGDWADYSCAGATVRRGKAPGISIPDQVRWATQERALGPATRAVSLTAGGNDSWSGRPHDALSAILAACVASGPPCGPGRRVGPLAQLLPEGLTALLPTGVAELLAAPLAGAREDDRWTTPAQVTAARATARLAPAVASIREAAPHATIALVGYPQVVPTSGRAGCAGPLGLGWSLEAGEVRYVNALLDALDGALRAAVADLDRPGAPVRYVDLRGPSRGHDLCAGPDAWVSAPVAQGLGFLGSSLHPNRRGMDAFATVVERLVDGTGLRPAVPSRTIPRRPGTGIAVATAAALAARR
jgi:lysophospholipase L1-like esterase